jgi:hypothetical protein
MDMTASEPGTRDSVAAKAASSPPFRIERVPYTNYPGSYYEGMYRVACTDCEWHGPSRGYNYAPDRLLIQYDQNAHERCPAAEAGREAEADA